MTHRSDISDFVPKATIDERPAYGSADPKTDPRWRYAGSEWARPTPGYPPQTASGEWMIPIIVNMPYGMIASLETEAQSGRFEHLVRAALVAAGHGKADDIAGFATDRFLDIVECAERAKRA